MTRIAEQKLKSTAETKSNVNIILKSKRFNQVLSKVVLRYRKFSYLKDKLFLRLNVLNITQQTFQRRFDVAFRLIWRRDVAQRQINIETTLCISTLNNVETTLCISMLNWTKLGNVEMTLSFSTSILTTLGNVETTLRIWPFEKKH